MSFIKHKATLSQLLKLYLLLATQCHFLHIFAKKWPVIHSITHQAYAIFIFPSNVLNSFIKPSFKYHIHPNRNTCIYYSTIRPKHRLCCFVLLDVSNQINAGGIAPGALHFFSEYILVIINGQAKRAR